MAARHLSTHIIMGTTADGRLLLEDDVLAMASAAGRRRQR
jgi:hypothetical protein